MTLLQAPSHDLQRQQFASKSLIPNFSFRMVSVKWEGRGEREGLTWGEYSMGYL